MLTPGEYAVTLRVLGQLVDARGAHASAVLEQPDHLTISWHHPDHGLEIQRYTRSSLGRLREEAARLRRQAREHLISRKGFNPPAERGELLRTLGQELDSQGASLCELRELDEAFAVSTMIEGRYTLHTYRWDELRQISQARRTEHTSARPRPPQEEPRPPTLLPD